MEARKILYIVIGVLCALILSTIIYRIAAGMEFGVLDITIGICFFVAIGISISAAAKGGRQNENDRNT